MKTILNKMQVRENLIKAENLTNFQNLSNFNLTKKTTLFTLFLVVFAFGQSFSQVTLSGKILDNSGEPLIGASIVIKDTTTGTVTDVDGSFSLNAPDSLVTLVVNYTGFATKEIDLSKPSKKRKAKQIYDLNNMNITLREDVARLEEVVVTAQGIKKEKKALGYSISTITLDNTLTSNSTRSRRSKKKKNKDVARILKGKASGVQITGNQSNSSKTDVADKIGIRKQKAQPKKRPVPHPTPDYSYENYDLINENEFLKAKQNPLSTFSIDVDAASYSNLRRFIQSGQAPPKDAVRIEEMINYFNYEYPNPTGEHPFEVMTEISDCPWNDEHRLVHIGLQGKKIGSEDLPPSNIVFLIDVSGSMSSSNKLPLLQTSFKMLVDQLRPQDKVSIAVYAGAAGLVLEPTSGDQKKTIKNAIDQMRAGGSTAGAAGIKLAYETARKNFVKGGNNRVILATDGDFNVGTSNDSELVRLIEKERKSGVFLTVLGFGTGNYQDAKMQKLADHGNGNHGYIDNLNEAKKVLVEEFGGTMFTIAKDVKLQIEFNPSKVESYRLIGYENRLLEDEDFNDDTKDAGELGAGHTVTALYEIIPKGSKSQFKKDVDELKYQSHDLTPKGKLSNELMTVKLRYKKPDGFKSRPIEVPVIDALVPIEKTTDNFRWSASVAGFGMLLRASKFKNDLTYAECLRLAEGAKGYDLNGYRAEMIMLLETMKGLVDPDLAGK